MAPADEGRLVKWETIMEEKKQSGLMLKDFCKEKNITHSQFYLWGYPKERNPVQFIIGNVFILFLKTKIEF